MSQLEVLQVGDEIAAIKLAPVSRMDLIKYSGASGDFNPIHTVDVEAEKAGLPGIIAHGMWTMGNLAKLFTPYIAEGFIQDYSIRFKRMVFIGDVITLKAVLREETEDAYTFNVVAENQAEKAVVEGQIVFQKV